MSDPIRILFDRCFRLVPTGRVTLSYIHAALKANADVFGIKYTLSLRSKKANLRKWILHHFEDQIANGQLSESPKYPLEYQGFALVDNNGAVLPPDISTKSRKMKEPSSKKSKAKKSKSPSSPPSSWYCSHCDAYHTLTSASPHQPFSRQHGFSIMKIDADGDCFYNCVLECLYNDEEYKEEMDEEFERNATPNDVGLKMDAKLSVTFMRDLVASKVRRCEDRKSAPSSPDPLVVRSSRRRSWSSISCRNLRTRRKVGWTF
jgi:hypothetical protein